MYEWTVIVGVGLLIGISFGILLQFRYIVELDQKIERLIEKLERMESREIEILAKKKKTTTKRRRK